MGNELGRGEREGEGMTWVEETGQDDGGPS